MMPAKDSQWHSKTPEGIGRVSLRAFIVGVSIWSCLSNEVRSIFYSLAPRYFRYHISISP